MGIEATADLEVALEAGDLESSPAEVGGQNHGVVAGTDDDTVVFLFHPLIAFPTIIFG